MKYNPISLQVQFKNAIRLKVQSKKWFKSFFCNWHGCFRITYIQYLYTIYTYTSARQVILDERRKSHERRMKQTTRRFFFKYIPTNWKYKEHGCIYCTHTHVLVCRCATRTLHVSRTTAAHARTRHRRKEFLWMECPDRLGCGHFRRFSSSLSADPLRHSIGRQITMITETTAAADETTYIHQPRWLYIIMFSLS